MKKKIIITIFILTLIVIWGHSCMPKTVSRTESDAVGGFLKPFLEIFVGEGNVTSHLVRKLAHFTEYGVLGIEVALMLVAKWLQCVRQVTEEVARRKEKSYLEKFFDQTSAWIRAIVSIAVAFAIASIDETIQIFSNRGPAFSDVLLDTAGAACGVALVLIIHLIRKR